VTRNRRAEQIGTGQSWKGPTRQPLEAPAGGSASSSEAADADRSKRAPRARRRAIGFPRPTHKPERRRPLIRKEVDEVDRPTRIVAIPGERLPRCCEYGAYPARSAGSPLRCGTGCGTDTFRPGRALVATPRWRRSAPRRCATRQRPSSQRESPRSGFRRGQLRPTGLSGEARPSAEAALATERLPTPSAPPEADGTSVPLRR
jgi:hypothetical protein